MEGDESNSFSVDKKDDIRQYVENRVLDITIKFDRLIKLQQTLQEEELGCDFNIRRCETIMRTRMLKVLSSCCNSCTMQLTNQEINQFEDIDRRGLRMEPLPSDRNGDMIYLKEAGEAVEGYNRRNSLLNIIYYLTRLHIKEHWIEKPFIEELQGLETFIYFKSKYIMEEVLRRSSLSSSSSLENDIDR